MKTLDPARQATWVVFVLDFVGRIWLAERRSHYLIRHVPDLLVLAVPVLRPLRLLRLLVLVKGSQSASWERASRAGRDLCRGCRGHRHFLRRIGGP